jgi:hypothetical protein
MIKRPLSITFFGCLFIVVSTLGLVYHLTTEFKPRLPFQQELFWISLVRILAIVGGVFLLRGHDWARWLLLAWMAFHVIISFHHPLPELIMHAVLFAILLYVFFRPRANAFFRGVVAPAAVHEPDDAPVV